MRLPRDRCIHTELLSRQRSMIHEYIFLGPIQAFVVDYALGQRHFSPDRWRIDCRQLLTRRIRTRASSRGLSFLLEQDESFERDSCWADALSFHVSKHHGDAGKLLDRRGCRAAGRQQFLASVFHDFSAPSSMGRLMQHFPELEDDDQTDMTCCDAYGHRNADFLTLGDLSHICISPADGVTSAYGDLCGMEEVDAAGTNLVVSPPSHSYGCHDSDIQFEAEGRGLDGALSSESASQSNSSLMEYGEACHSSQQADGSASISPEAVWTVDPPTSTGLFSSHQQGQALVSTPAPTPSRSPVFNSVSSLKTGDAAPLISAGDSPGTVSSGWRQPIVPDMSGFVDLSDFLSPRLSTPMQLSAEQLASLGMDSSANTPLHSHAAGHNMMASTTDPAKGRPSNSFGMPENEEQQLREFPVTFVSVRQDQVNLDPVKSRLPGHSYMASSNLASFLTPAVEQQLRRTAKGPWNSAIPSCFSSPKIKPDQDNSASSPVPSVPAEHCEPQRMPVNALAPVTPEKPRKRRTLLHRQQKDQKPQGQKHAGSSTDHFIPNVETVPAKSSGARKLQKTATSVEQISAFEQEQVGKLHSHLLETILGGNPGNMVFPAQKDVLKAGDHVARERRRRDLMNTRYQTLESLLPNLPCRRDRFGIVEDTKVYVKEMEQKLSDLKKTKEEGQARLEAAKVEKAQQQPGNKKTAVSEPAAAAKLSPNGTYVPDVSISNDLNVEVVLDQNDEEQDIVIFVQCRSSSGAKLISSLLRALEKLQLDVSQCSTSKSSQIYFCSAVCKLQRHVLKSSLSREKMIQEMVTTLRPFVEA